MLQKASHRLQDFVRKGVIRYGAGLRHRLDERAEGSGIALDLAARLSLLGSNPRSNSEMPLPFAVRAKVVSPAGY
jgi:hypothetical protein